MCQGLGKRVMEAKTAFYRWQLKISMTRSVPAFEPLVLSSSSYCWWPLLKVKVESEKVVLKLNIQKRKIMASGAITLWQTDGETMETFLGLQNYFGWRLQP